MIIMTPASEQNADYFETPTSELIELCSYDSNLFKTEFFPVAVRQKSPAFHDELWRILESSARQVNVQVPRGFAKTTNLRIYVSKRIVYGISRTIMYVGLSQDKAVQSLTWIRKHIEHNKKLRHVYQVDKGSKWQDVHCEIIHKLFGHTITVLAYGVTGSIRGVNIDDYRPDLIVCDDIVNMENASTPEQRKKINELVYGDLMASLAPTSDSPDAKFVMLQTPLKKEEVSTKALTDPSWVSMKFSCWTKESKFLPENEKISSWPERYPSEELRASKQAYLNRNESSVWYREYECQIKDPEEASFKSSWLKFYDLPPERNELHVIAAIDPVPPPTEIQIQKGMKGKDDECLAVVGTTNGNDYFLLDYLFNKGHEPNWTIDAFFKLSLKWHPSVWVVESVGYQKTLEWILRKAMKESGIYFPIIELEDTRKKYDRIVDSLAGPSSNGAFHVHKSHVDFIQQFNEYPDVTHDDILDAVSMGMIHMSVFQGVDTSLMTAVKEHRPRAVSEKLNYGYGAP